MAKELLSVRCPEDIAQTIQEQMELSGQDRTTVVIDMLRSSGSFLSLPIEDKNKLPSISGIYFVFASNKLLYVGRSVDLKQRWQNHHRYGQFKLIQDARIAWFECDSSLLPEFETSLIEFLEPDYNRSPDGLFSDGKIQFRLSEDELEVLKCHVRDGESIHLAAKRILREALGVNKTVNDAYTSTTDERIASVVEEKLYAFSAKFNEQANYIQGRIQSLQESMQSLQERMQTVEARAIAPSPTSQVQIEDKPIVDSGVDDVDLTLTGRELAQRLQVHPATLTKNRTKPTFTDWTRDRDPEGKAWQYLLEIERYAPLLSTVMSTESTGAEDDVLAGWKAQVDAVVGAL